MMKKEEAASAATETTPKSEPAVSLLTDPIKVKVKHEKIAINDLRELRISRQIPAREMVAVVQKIYPKYDKTIQSKCENGDAYGIGLRPDALNALYTAFAPEAIQATGNRKKERHRLTCRVSARLEKTDYERLQQLIKADGYSTMQEWLAWMVKQYIQRKDGADV